MGANRKRGCNQESYSGRTTSHKPDVSAFTMSPSIWAFPAQLFLGDFHALRLTGPRTATGMPRLVIVTGPPCCSISSRTERHLALNSVAFTTSVFIICSHDSTMWSSDQIICETGSPGPSPDFV